jgi:hypothetical protein
MVEDRILVSFRQDNRAVVILASLAGIIEENLLGFFIWSFIVDFFYRCNQILAINPSCDAVIFVLGLGR